MSLKTLLYSTYTGYLLQVLPIALAAGLIGGLVKYFACRERSVGRALSAGLFISYLTGLLCLVFAMDAISVVWNRLAFHAESGVRLLTADGSRLSRLMPSFLKKLTGEQIGNIRRDGLPVKVHSVFRIGDQTDAMSMPATGPFFCEESRIVPRFSRKSRGLRAGQ